MVYSNRNPWREMDAHLGIRPILSGRSGRNPAFRIDNEFQQTIKRREYEDSDGAAQLIPEFLSGSEFTTTLLVIGIRYFKDLMHIKGEKIEQQQII